MAMTSTTDHNGDPSNAVLYFSIVGIAAISWLLWKFLFAPPPRPGASSVARAGVQPAATATGGDVGTASSSSSSGAVAKTASGIDGFAFGTPRCPPHLVAPAGWDRAPSDLSGRLLQGIVPFRSTPAAGHENRSKEDADAVGALPAEDAVMAHRRERARIFARMFSKSKAGGAVGGRPPNRGANVVVAIHHTEIHSPKLQKVLFLLGTYYNLFVVIDGSGVVIDRSGATPDRGDDMVVTKIIETMRSGLLNLVQGPASNALSAEILPPHRIAVSSTSKGRVAFVRQLHGAELILDFEEDVIQELQRFGFRVVGYPRASKAKAEPSLGDFLVQ